MKHIAFLLIFVCQLNSYAQTVTVHYQTEKFDVAIFPAESKDLLPGAVRFTPSREDIDKAENALLKQLPDLNADKQNQDNTPVIDKNLKKYRRQYFGYINEKGDKILYINCFWKKDKGFENWMSEMVRVDAGGSYYWYVKYNLNKDELFDLTVNPWE
jgi:hypothetical protein